MADLIKSIYPTGENATAGLEIDAFFSEKYHFGNRITDIPIEEGSNIADHVTPEPDTLDIEAFIGMTKFEVVATDVAKSAPAESPGNPKQRIIEAHQELLRLKRSMQPMDIVAGLDTMTNMVIETYDVSHDVESGADLPFSMTFKKIDTVKSETTQIIASKPKAGMADQVGGVANKGQSGKSEPDNPQSKIFKEAADRNKAAGAMTEQEYAEAGAAHGF
jgi:hypothetical protein